MKSEIYASNDKNIVESENNENSEETETEEDCDKVCSSSTEAFSSIEAGDSCMELIGYVTDIQAPKLVKNNKLLVYSFYLNNSTGNKYRVVAWNDQVDRVQKLTKFRSVMHIDGARVDAFVDQKYNKGSGPIQLTIQTNTLITILAKKYDLGREEKDQYLELTNLENVWQQLTKFTKVRGFIKTNFELLKFSSNENIIQ